MYLLHCAANGRLAQALSEEGGLESISWAGKRGKNEPALFTSSQEAAGLSENGLL
jgi:predicted ATPase